MGDIKNEVKSYIAATGYTLTEIVDRVNKARPAAEKKTTPQNITNKLTRGTIRYGEVKEIAKAAGYEIIWKKSQ